MIAAVETMVRKILRMENKLWLPTFVGTGLPNHDRRDARLELAIATEVVKAILIR